MLEENSFGVTSYTIPKNGHTYYFRRELRNNLICDLPWNHLRVEYQGCYYYNEKGQNTCVKILFCIVYHCHVRHFPLCDLAFLSSSDVSRCPSG